MVKYSDMNNLREKASFPSQFKEQSNHGRAVKAAGARGEASGHITFITRKQLIITASA